MNDKVEPCIAKGFHLVGASTYAIANAFIQAKDLPTVIRYADEVFHEMDSQDRVLPGSAHFQMANRNTILRLSDMSPTTIVTLVEESLHRSAACILDKIRHVFHGIPENAPTLARSFWVEDVHWKPDNHKQRKLVRFVNVLTAQGAHRDTHILDVKAAKFVE